MVAHEGFEEERKSFFFFGDNYNMLLTLQLESFSP